MKHKYIVVFDSSDDTYLTFKHNGRFWQVLEEKSSDRCWFKLDVVLSLFDGNILVGKSFKFRRSSRDSVPSWLECVTTEGDYRVTTGDNIQSILTMSELIS